MTRDQLARAILAAAASGSDPTRETVETVLDFNITLEGTGSNAIENDLEFEDHQVRYKDVLDKGKALIRRYGMRFPSLEDLQDEFYSFTNSSKYLRSITTCSVARSTLAESWDGLHGWKE